MTTLRRFVTELAYKTDRRSFRQATAVTREMKGELVGLTRTAGSAGRALTGAIAGFLSFQAGSSFIKGVVQASAANQSLSASLEVIEGSAEGANKALAKITKFTQTTPFQMQEVADAFISLKNQGLDASEASLTSFGNTAASMGKPLQQVIEAVGDATRGSNERLIEAFGITAKKVGNKTEFLFKGQRTLVKNNAEDIQAFLKGIGDTDFSGAMEKQMDTLSGRFSNLKGVSNDFAIAIGKAGLNDAIASVTDQMIAASKGSGGLAKSIGEGLGKAVMFVGEAMAFLSDNIEEVKIGLTALAGLFAVQKVIDFKNALFAADGALMKVASSLGQMAITLATNPIILLAGLVIGAVAAIVIFREEIAAWANETAEAGGVLGAFAGLVQVFANELIPQLVEAAGEIFAALAPLGEIVGEIFGIFAEVIAEVLPPLIEMISVIVRIQVTLTAAIAKFFAVLIKPILGIVKMMIKGGILATKIIGKFVVFMGKASVAMIDPIVDAFNAMSDVISDFVESSGSLLFGFFDMITEMGGAILDPISGAFDSFVDFLRKIVRQIPDGLLTDDLRMFATGLSQSELDASRAATQTSLAGISAQDSATRLKGIVGGTIGVSETVIQSMTVEVNAAPDMAPSEVRSVFAGGVKDAFDTPATSARDFTSAFLEGD